MQFSEIIPPQGAAKRMAVIAAEDAGTMEAALAARRLGYIEPVLVGRKDEMLRISQEAGLELFNVEMIDAQSHLEAAEKGVQLVSSGQAHALMKGLLHSSVLMRAVLNKEWGLGTGGLISYVSLVESPHLDRLLFVTDAGMVMYPDLAQKAAILSNAVTLARRLGQETPKVACVAAVEEVNAAMQATLDAAALTMMNQRGQIKNCVVDGPLGLDNAISRDASEKKGVQSSIPVAGAADILLMPNIEVGNIMLKACRFLGGCKTGGVLMGASAPIALTSRADSTENKLRSIICAISAC